MRNRARSKCLHDGASARLPPHPADLPCQHARRQAAALGSLSPHCSLFDGVSHKLLTSACGPLSPLRPNEVSTLLRMLASLPR